MGYYIKNLETQKIELHFDKVEYQALSTETKKEIKSAFLFSSYASAWVSRSKNNHYRAISVAKKLGLEDKGEKGEKLSYSEQVECKQEKAERRADRFETYADNADKRSENLQSEFNKHRKDWSWLTQADA